uniref:Uncharacterized protein AlNc14C82G5336 n=1 Tax=Albugo laibachii Nc14 TaxID=890382 RepID=F0WFE7_9STRA|nr:cleavage induced hypothetical protein [Albugo laibachii Nc14]|eukprot:CCA19929.1 cleavage induced hypothetical protein [Albugo laibachii Nc14]
MLSDSPNWTDYRSSTRGNDRRVPSNLDSNSLKEPSIWMIDNWLEYPIIENFHGPTTRSRTSSFHDVMLSPTIREVSTTLSKFCCSYEQRYRNMYAFRHGFEDGNFSDVEGTSMKELPNAKERDLCRITIEISARDNTDKESHVVIKGTLPLPICISESNKGRLLSVPSQMDLVKISDMSPTSTHSKLSSTDSPMHLFNLALSSTSIHSRRLHYKLHDLLREIDIKIENGKLESIRATQRSKVVVKLHRDNTNVMWDLFCGARMSSSMRYDGLEQLCAKLCVAMHNRSLNQLKRHRRHVNGILQIITSHNPDLEITEKQLDSLESVEAMLDHDIKYSVLHKQLQWLDSLLIQRKKALVLAKSHNGSDCFENIHTKKTMMRKLLEAVSWYRLVQVNCRKECTSALVAEIDKVQGDEDRKDQLSYSQSRLPLKPESELRASKSALEERQVEKILSLLDGEDFHTEFSKRMCDSDWWEQAQAYFENLIFSRSESRICQVFFRLSMDVAKYSFEDLEGLLSHPTREGKERNTPSNGTSQLHGRATSYRFVDASKQMHQQILDLKSKLIRTLRQDFDIANNVSMSLNIFVQRTIFPRLSLLCFTQQSIRECQRKDQHWRKVCSELRGIAMEAFQIPIHLTNRIQTELPYRRLSSSRHKRSHPDFVYLTRSIDAFSAMRSIVPCDLLDELMQGIVVLHHEAALVLGTTQFSVQIFFPLLAYVLLHSDLPHIHAQLHLLDHFAINNSNINGEDSYYVYCVHGAIEYICNSAHSIMSEAQKCNVDRNVISPTKVKYDVEEKKKL